MTLLRNAARLAVPVRRVGAPLARVARVQPLAVRCFASRSLPRFGHNLEDHYDMAEFMTKMHHPMGEYVIWFAMFMMFVVTAGPLIHSNYYFTGRWLPKDQGNTQLCDD